MLIASPDIALDQARSAGDRCEVELKRCDKLKAMYRRASACSRSRVMKTWKRSIARAESHNLQEHHWMMLLINDR